MSYFWNTEQDEPTASGIATIIAVIVLFILILIALPGAITRCGPGQVCLVRNGGPFDNNKIRQTMTPAHPITWTGWFSSIRHYPATDVQRFYTITSDASRGDRAGVDFIEVPTQDGVQVRLEGTIFFHTSFTGTAHDQLLRAFDERFGNRTFDGKHVWEGDSGWSAFLDAQLRPVVDNDLREQIGRFRCDELVSSCALISAGQQASVGSTAKPRSAGGQDNQRNIIRIQDAINAGLEGDLRSNLGGDYLRDVHFTLARVVLPDQVQGAIDHAQAEFAGVSQARARVQQAKFEAQRNKLLATQFLRSPQLAMIEAVKAAPSGAQVILNVGGTSPGLNIGK